jgi:cyanophycinase-like exopeptidase
MTPGPKPRLLTIMGSGETSPTMVKTHRDLLGRLGHQPPAVLLDTPFGFQENAADISAKAVEYFAESVGARIEVASFKSALDAEDTLAHESMLARLRSALYVFAGPGSPSYALRQWSGTQIPDLLREKLASGGAVTFASAAAVTLGILSVPVYEIYKVGEDPRWLEGLDLLAATGLRAAVIPHYNNAEGGTHDTRFCYLGERRLSAMEKELPDDAFVLGVDEHTGCVMDLEDRTATVVGLGVVTVRSKGRSSEIPTGATLGLDDLSALASRPGAAVEGAARAGAPADAGAAAEAVGASPLLESVRTNEAEFDSALEARHVGRAVRALLELEDTIRAWSADTLQSDELDRARGALRSMIVRLGELAETGARDPAELLGPFVDALLEARNAARSAGRYAEADAIRDRVIALGVEVRDTEAGTEWELGGGPG